MLLADTLVATRAARGFTLAIRHEPAAARGAAPARERGAIPAGADNLVLRAARLVHARLGLRGGARFRLVKRIPAQAGMGGGSADAGVAGLGGAEMSAVLGAGSEVPGSIGQGSLGGFGGQVVVSSGESVGVLGMVLLPVMGSLLVLLAVSLILQ